MTSALLRLAVSPLLFQAALLAALIAFGLFFDRAAQIYPEASLQLLTAEAGIGYMPAAPATPVLEASGLDDLIAWFAALPQRELTGRPS